MAESSNSRENLQSQLKESLFAFATQELSGSSAKSLYDFLQYEMITDQSMIHAALTGAVEKAVLAPKEAQPLKNFYDLMFSSDSEFDQTFKIHRTTIQWLLKEMKCVSQEIRNDQGVVKSLCCLVYYLANADVALAEVRRIFSYESDEALIEDFVRVSKVLLDIGEKVNLRWPIESEAFEIAERFNRKHKFPDVMGVIGHCIFGTRERGVIFQGVIDDRLLYYDLNAKEVADGKPELESFFASTTTQYYVNGAVPSDLSILSKFNLPSESNCFTYPFSGNLDEGERNFNESLLKAIDLIFYRSLRRQVDHFPRLDTFLTANDSSAITPAQAKWIILGSCVIQNASNILIDLVPY